MYRLCIEELDRTCAKLFLNPGRYTLYPDPAYLQVCNGCSPDALMLCRLILEKLDKHCGTEHPHSLHVAGMLGEVLYK